MVKTIQCMIKPSLGTRIDTINVCFRQWPGEFSNFLAAMRRTAQVVRTSLTHSLCLQFLRHFRSDLPQIWNLSLLRVKGVKSVKSVKSVKRVKRVKSVKSVRIPDGRIQDGRTLAIWVKINERKEEVRENTPWTRVGPGFRDRMLAVKSRKNAWKSFFFL